MAGKETTDTLKITFPRIAPYRKVGDYIKSQQEVRHVQQPGCQWDKPRTDPDLHLIAARRTYEKTVEALEKRKEFYKKEQIVLAKQWEDLLQEEQSLRENFVRMSAFIKSNQEKRDRAVRRRIEDSHQCQERTKQIEEITEKTALLQKGKEDLDKEIEKLKIYQKYLNKVVEISTDFRNPVDILDRYESLVSTKAELGERQNNTLLLLEKSKSEITKLVDQNNFLILGMKNVIANLHARYQTGLTNAMHWERIVSSIKHNALQKFKEINEVKQACRNIYLIMCKRKSETPKIAESDFEKQLIYIKKTLQELALVRSEAAGITKKTFSSMKGETSKVS